MSRLSILTVLSPRQYVVLATVTHNEGTTRAIFKPSRQFAILIPIIFFCHHFVTVITCLARWDNLL